jgi:hypothetical protein
MVTPWKRTALGASCLALASALYGMQALAQDTSNKLPAAPAAVVPEPPVDVPAEPAATGPAPGRAVKATEPVSATGAPFQVGSFLVYPEMDVSWMHDSNVFYTNQSPVSDDAWIYSPAIWVQSNWAKHALNFYASGDWTRYQKFESEDTDDYRVSAEGRYDFNADANVYGGARVGQEHEDRESPDTRNGLVPTKYYEQRYYGGIFRQLDRLSLRVAGTAQHLNYSNVPFVTGSGAINIINNDDRDRWQYTGGARLGWEVSPRLEPYVQVALDNRLYDIVPDDHDYQKSSAGQRYLAGLRWNAPRTLKLDAFGGYMTQDYRDPRFATVNAPLYGAALLWSVGERTTVSAYLDRTIEETSVFEVLPGDIAIDASSYLNTYASAGVTHRFTDRLSARVNGSWSRVDYQEFSRTDDYTSGTVGLLYKLRRYLYIDVSFTERKLDSSIPDENFAKRMTFVRAAIPFSR